VCLSCRTRREKKGNTIWPLYFNVKWMCLGARVCSTVASSSSLVGCWINSSTWISQQQGRRIYIYIHIQNINYKRPAAAVVVVKRKRNKRRG
jgi:hypothetical protein